MNENEKTMQPEPTQAPTSEAAPKLDQANFRMTRETADRFRGVCKELQTTHQGGMEKLLDNWDLNGLKGALPERKLDIEDFEAHANAILSSFVRSLELAHTTEDRVREQYRKLLESKDETIMNLQDQIRGKEELAVASNTAYMEAENSKKQAEEERREALERMKAAEKMAADKEKIASMLQTKLEELEEQLQGYPELKKEKEDLKTQVKDLEFELDHAKWKNKNEAEKAKAEIMEMKKQAELDQEKALARLQKECDQHLSEELKKAAEELTKTKIDLASAQTRAIEKENQVARLEEKNEKLQTTINELRFTIAGMVAKSMEETAEEDEKSQE